ncbi:hypothetical protein DUI87_18147 [Hirundo rustica rustica]|uniref:RNA-directed DNA polymerase n=1 Tax=Hirundo rustica rustica TaxID=333673 RepID=A0A3M0KCR9_HIRRU|nr:hypothetical protein DUI87_18147 [Hirundo rustica rustica]
MTLPDHDVSRPCLTTECLQEPFRLQLTESLHLSDTDWHLGSLDLQVPGSWQHVGSKYVILGDTKYTLREIEILPGLVSSNPKQLVLWLRCVRPPLFLPKGQIIAQAIPAPDPFPGKNITRNKHLDVCPTRVIGRDKLIIECEVRHSGEAINLKGVLDTVHAAVGEAIILHYVDDVLMCAPNDDLLSHALDLTIDSLVAAGFELQEEKIQRMPPWKYLGLEIGKWTIVPQKLVVKNNIRTLADVQQLCGSLNWQWEKDIVDVEGLPQVAELAAIVRAFEKFPEPFNLVTDSAYVAGVVSRAEQAVLSEVSNSTLFNLLSKPVNLISHREKQFYVMHIRSHTNLPGFIAEGNGRADALAAPVEMAPLPNNFGQAKISHQLFHQNASGLVHQFHLTREQARAIVAPSPLCQQHALPALSAGVNPRGLNSCEVWQTDVTHIMSSGRQRYVHVSVDTFSGAVYDSAHTGEKSSDAMKHLIQAFSFLGIPKSIKTDNGPTYTSKEFRSFLQQWGVEHKTGIPYSPTGQAIVERTHQNLKRVLSQQHQSLKLETPQIHLSKAFFTLNFLNCTFENLNPPKSQKGPQPTTSVSKTRNTPNPLVQSLFHSNFLNCTFENLNPPTVRHFRENCQLQLKAKPPVMVKDPATRETEGPHDLITWGRGHTCVSTPSGPKWVPAKWVKPFIPKTAKPPAEAPQVASAAWRRRKSQTLSF